MVLKLLFQCALHSKVRFPYKISHNSVRRIKHWLIVHACNFLHQKHTSVLQAKKFQMHVKARFPQKIKTQYSALNQLLARYIASVVA